MKNFTIVRAVLMLLFFSLTAYTGWAQNCTVNAGTLSVYCNQPSFRLNGKTSNNGATAADILWTQVGGTNNLLTIQNPNSLVTDVTDLLPGLYVFRLTVKCPDGINNFNDVLIVILPTPPKALAGPDQIVCSPSSIQLAANAAPLGTIGEWSLVSGSGSFSSVNDPNAVFTASGKGEYQLRWTIFNVASCVESDDMMVKVLGGDQPVSAGPDITLTCSGSSITLNGSDQGLAPQAGLWTFLAGPNVPIIGAPDRNSTVVNGLVPGTYTFRWTVSGPCFTGQDDVTVVVTDVKQSPQTGGSKTQTYCRQDNVTSVVLSAAPLGAGETGTWTQTGGPAGAIIVSPNSANTQVNGLSGVNNYRFVWTVTNTGNCSASATHSINVVPDFSDISVPSNQILGCQENTTTVNVTYDYGGITSSSGLTRNATLISSPLANGSRVKFSRSGAVGNDLWRVTGLDSAGLYNVQFEYRNNCATVFRNVFIVVSDTTSVPNAGSDVLLPCNEFQTEIIAADIPPFRGRGTWSKVAGPPANILDPTSARTQVLLSIDADYIFRWSVENGPGCLSRFDDIVVTKSSQGVVPADAGNDTTICAGPFRLMASIPGRTQVGTWTGLPSNVSISNINDPGATITGMTTGQVFTLTWTISNACDSKQDQVVITVNNEYSFDALAGPDKCLPSGTTTVQLNGSDPGAGVPFWTALDGASVDFTQQQNATGNIPADGTYRFVYNIQIPGCNINNDTVVVTVSNPTTVATAGTDQYICLPSANLPTTTTLQGNVAQTGTGTWRQVGGNAGPVITDPSDPATTITNLAIGTFDFEWLILNGACDSTRDTVRIFVAAAPEPVDAGTGAALCNITTGTVIQLNAQPVTNGAGLWTVDVSPGGGSPPIFSDPGSPTSTVRNLQNGRYIFRWNTVSQIGCPVFSDTVIYDIAIRADAGPNSTGACDITTAQLTGNPNTDGLWQFVSGPNTPTLANDNPTLNAALASDLVFGTYRFSYTLPAVGACPSTSDQISVVINQSPTPANAGDNAVLCPGTTSVTLTGNIPTVGTSLWTFLSGPNTPTGTGTTTNEATFNGLVPGVYEFVYSTISPSCPVSRDNVLVTVTNGADAGTNQRICAALATGSAVTLTGNTPVGFAGTWTRVSGPGTANILSPNNPITLVSGLVPGLHVFKWLISTPTACGSNEDLVQVLIDPPLSITNIAGPDPSKCAGPGNIVLGNGTGPTDATYEWTPSAFLTSTNTQTTEFTATGAGNYTYTLLATRGACTAADQVTISVFNVPVKPVLSGPTNICENTTTTVSVVSVEPNVTYNWVDQNNNSLGSGTSKVVGPGTYTVTPVGNSGGCDGPSESITIIGDQLPTTAIAASNQQLCQNITTTILVGNTPVVGQPRWSFVSGPSTPALSPSSGAASTVNVSNLANSGVYTFTYTISNGTCPPSTDNLLVVKEVVANAGNDQRLCNAATANLSARAPIIYPGSWSVKSKPVGAPDPVFDNANSASTVVRGLSFQSTLSGTYEFTYTINSGGSCPLNADDVTIIVDAPVTVDAGPSTSKCTNDVGVIANIGTAGIAGVQYAWTPSNLVADPAATPTIFTGTQPGRTELTLTATNGACTASDKTAVTINLPPATPIVSAPPAACANGTVLATVTNAEPDVIYTWFSSGGIVAVGNQANLPPGDFSVVAENDATCVSQVFGLNIGSLTPPDASFTQQEGCTVEYLANDAGPGATYRWTFLPDGVPATAFGPGEHSVAYGGVGPKSAVLQVTDANGCSDVQLQSLQYTCTILPLVLLQFDAIWQQAYPEISWKLDRIEDMQQVLLQRSTNGSTFTTATTITGNDRQRGIQIYTFLDKQLPTGVTAVYYRLQMVSKDGTVQYSPIRQVSKAPTWSVTANPNPFTDRVLLTIESPVQQAASILLVAADGRVVLEQKQALLRGINTVDIRNLGYLPAGNYWIRVDAAGPKGKISVLKAGR